MGTLTDFSLSTKFPRSVIEMGVFRFRSVDSSSTLGSHARHPSSCDNLHCRKTGGLACEGVVGASGLLSEGGGFGGENAPRARYI